MLEDAKVEMYRGSMRLVVDKSGRVEQAEDKFTPKVSCVAHPLKSMLSFLLSHASNSAQSKEHT